MVPDGDIGEGRPQLSFEGNGIFIQTSRKPTDICRLTQVNLYLPRFYVASFGIDII
jgi:hypothetical protein